MPELPEVEIVRRGLASAMEGNRFARAELRRADLRYPLPDNFARRLEGASVDALARRGKYLIAHLSSGECLIMHLGMSGRFVIDTGARKQPWAFARAKDCDPRHDHVIFIMDGARRARIAFNDPRRFGLMDLVATKALEECRHFKDMGPEPFSNAFSAAGLKDALRHRKTLIKAALLDQRVVAGLGNIYACEALYRARISPRRLAASVAGLRSERLYRAILEVLREAIDAGGSTLRDFASAEGGLGYFQHRFAVYDREREPCRRCATSVRRLVQGGRSTFFCPLCQR